MGDDADDADILGMFNSDGEFDWGDEDMEANQEEPIAGGSNHATLGTALGADTLASSSATLDVGTLNVATPAAATPAAAPGTSLQDPEVNQCTVDTILQRLCDPKDVLSKLDDPSHNKTDLFLSLIPVECRDALVFPSTLYEENSEEWDIRSKRSSSFDPNSAKNGFIAVDTLKAERIFADLAREGKVQDWVDEKVFTMFLCLVANMRARGINKHGLLFNDKSFTYSKCLLCNKKYDDLNYHETRSIIGDANSKIRFGCMFGKENDGTLKPPDFGYPLHKLYWLYHEHFHQDREEYQKHYVICDHEGTEEQYRTMQMQTFLKINLARSIAAGEESLLKFMLYSDYPAAFLTPKSGVNNFELGYGEKIVPITMEYQEGSQVMKKASVKKSNGRKRKDPPAHEEGEEYKALRLCLQILNDNLGPASSVQDARIAIKIQCCTLSINGTKVLPESFEQTLRLKAAKILYTNARPIKEKLIASAYRPYTPVNNPLGDGYGLGVTREQADAFHDDWELDAFYEDEKANGVSTADPNGVSTADVTTHNFPPPTTYGDASSSATFQRDMGANAHQGLVELPEFPFPPFASDPNPVPPLSFASDPNADPVFDLL